MSALACIRCKTVEAAGFCCNAHGKQLCHLCYRRTHFVEICIADCPDCAREGLNPAGSVRDRPKLAQGGVIRPPGGFDLPTIATVSVALRRAEQERDQAFADRDRANDDVTDALAERDRALQDRDALGVKHVETLRVIKRQNTRLDQVRRERDEYERRWSVVGLQRDAAYALVEKIPGRQPIDVLREVVARGEDARIELETLRGHDDVAVTIARAELTSAVIELRHVRVDQEIRARVLREKNAKLREVEHLLGIDAIVPHADVADAVRELLAAACPDPAAHQPTEGKPDV